MINDTLGPVRDPNALRSNAAERIAFLVDAADYFAAVESAMQQATNEIFIIAWDFNPDIKLRPQDSCCPTLGDFLSDCVRKNPSLNVRILVWALGPIYCGKSLELMIGRRWPKDPAIELRFDFSKTIRGSHHQKLVVIDGHTAFVGGIDLTARRWDTSAHDAYNPHRITPDGDMYEPVHDIQCVFDGEAARAAHEIARQRWMDATGDTIGSPNACSPVWPEAVLPQFLQSRLTLSRSVKSSKESDLTESVGLTLDLLARARKHIYIESQYFASSTVCNLLCERLGEPEGPEVIILTTSACHGYFERRVLGENRDRLVRKLMQHDMYHRLRARYPVVRAQDGKTQEILVHSKLIIIDDVAMRVGSSNLNQRSENIDSELDVSIWAKNDRERTTIALFRNGLLAEHLGVTSQRINTEIAQRGLCETIDTSQGNKRSLEVFTGALGEGKTELVRGTGFVDPRCAWWPLQYPVFWLRKHVHRLIPGAASFSHR